MGAGIPLQNLSNPSLSLNPSLHISQESVDVLVNGLNNNISLIDKAGIIAAIASAISTFFALLVIIQNKKNQQGSLVQTLHDHFFKVNKHFAALDNKSPSFQDHQLQANFLERVADLVKSKQISKKMVIGYKSMAVEPNFKKFLKRYRSKYGENYFSSLNWLIGEYQSKKDKKSLIVRIIKKVLSGRKRD